MTDYIETYNDFWREIVECPDGTLNRDQVMRELHDYRVAIEEISKAYDEITGGRLSKPNTAAHHIVAIVQERINAAAEAARAEAGDELIARFEEMRENGEQDMRTVISRVRDVTGSSA